eukprot:903857-Amorphochlora_amoeboformis.AAC.1
MGLITAEGGPPADQYYACYVILFYMALATLLPWVFTPKFPLFRPEIKTKGRIEIHKNCEV